MSKLIRIGKERTMSQIFEFIAFAIALISVISLSLQFFAYSFMITSSFSQLLFFARLIIAGFMLIIVSLGLSVFTDRHKRNVSQI
jgi:hypothetical protein